LARAEQDPISESRPRECRGGDRFNANTGDGSFGTADRDKKRGDDHQTNPGGVISTKAAVDGDEFGKAIYCDDEAGIEEGRKGGEGGDQVSTDARETFIGGLPTYNNKASSAQVCSTATQEESRGEQAERGETAGETAGSPSEAAPAHESSSKESVGMEDVLAEMRRRDDETGKDYIVCDTNVLFSGLSQVPEASVESGAGSEGSDEEKERSARPGSSKSRSGRSGGGRSGSASPSSDSGLSDVSEVWDSQAVQGQPKKSTKALSKSEEKVTAGEGSEGESKNAAASANDPKDALYPAERQRVRQSIRDAHGPYDEVITPSQVSQLCRLLTYHLGAV